MILREFRQGVRTLKGVGPVLERVLARLGVRTLGDLLRHYPREYRDRTRLDRLADLATAPQPVPGSSADGTAPAAAPDDVSAHGHPAASELHRQATPAPHANVLVQVAGQAWIGSGWKKTLKVEIRDESGRAYLFCFGRSFLSGVLVPGRRFWVSGRFQRRAGQLQCSDFEYEEAEGLDGGAVPITAPGFLRIVPVYPLTEGVSQAVMRRLVAQALDLADGELEDELPPELIRRWGLPGKRAALRALHQPDSDEALETARRALAGEERFHLQLFLARSAARREAVTRRRPAIPFRLRAELLRRLPFALTPDQARALGEIEGDLFAPHPHGRLLQGDVGSGKTLVAFLTALSVIEAGEQAALMAPTELLARQHAENAARLLEPLGVRVALLAGGLTAEARAQLLRALAAGEVDLLVGTHALFSADVVYRRLGLVVVDEQQRFGVRQRQAVLAKGGTPDLLMMTATPIPRTLCLALFGDLELSEIRTMPPGRQPVVTHLAREGNEAKVYEWVRREVGKGRQAYFIYPLIDESEKVNLKNVTEMFERLRGEVFPEFTVGMIHSRVPEEEKRPAMAAFEAGRTQILVATNVLEVGVDIPNATCLVVEHAERFGLSALHQLRGRVGRGPEQAYAFFVYSRRLTEDGVRRLRTILTERDGFRIAEEDLKIRGPGEFLGLRQSGYLQPALADPDRDPEAWLEARRAARELVAEDPELQAPGHRVLRRVLAETSAEGLAGEGLAGG